MYPIPYILGAIPNGIGKLVRLTELWLQKNKLTGLLIYIHVHILNPVYIAISYHYGIN